MRPPPLSWRDTTTEIRPPGAGPSSDFYFGGTGFDFAVFEGAKAEWTRVDMASDLAYGAHTRYTRTLTDSTIGTEHVYAGVEPVQGVVRAYLAG